MSVIGLSKNSIYDQLNSFTLGDVPAANVNNQQEPVNIMKVNESRLDQLNRINKSLFRDGNPMPQTMKIVSVTLNENDVKKTLIQPTKGEVWKLLQASVVRSSGTGTTDFYIQYYDGTNEANFLFAATGGSELILTSDDNYAGNDFFADNNVYIRGYRSAGTATYDMYATFTRVR